VPLLINIMWMHYEDLNVYTVRKISSQLTCIQRLLQEEKKNGATIKMSLHAQSQYKASQKIK